MVVVVVLGDSVHVLLTATTIATTATTTTAATTATPIIPLSLYDRSLIHVPISHGCYGVQPLETY